MSVRPQIDDPQGVEDPRATSILRTMKSIIDSITGRRQGQNIIALLDPAANINGIISKVNELIRRLQSLPDPTGIPKPASPTRIEDLVVDGKIRINTDNPSYSWRDIIGDISPKFTGVGSAELAAYRGGQYAAFFYTTNDVCNIVYHIPHDYVRGSPLLLHLHWGHNGTAISGSLVVTFGITYGDRQGTVVMTTEVAPVLTVNPDITNYPRWCHKVDEIPITIPGGAAALLDQNKIEVDGLVNVGLIVTTIPTISGGTKTKPAFFTLDIHYQSTNMGTVNNAPNYYA